MEKNWWDTHPEYAWIDEYCAAKQGAEREYKEEWEAWRYLIGGKMFAFVANNTEGQPILTVKLDPVFGQALRQEHEGKIIPGYYMNKTHWNSVLIESDVSDDLRRETIDQSYDIIFSSLTKKAQKEIETQ